MILPWMQTVEIISILKLLEPNHTVLEWGCGGSTILFSPFVKHYYSIEHKKSWYERVRDELELYKNDNVSLYLVEVKDNYKEYVKKVDDLNVPKFDIVLIDGRNRVNCGIHVLPYIDIESIVILHDAKRPKYQELLEYYDLLAQIRGIYFLTKKW